MPSAAVRSGPEWQNCYESLRRQALETGSGVRHTHAEVTFIERQGLAAWLAHTPDRPADGAEPASPQTAQLVEAGPPRGDLIQVLADLVLGDRQEKRDDR
jgi:hypothetical protein